MLKQDPSVVNCTSRLFHLACTPWLSTRPQVLYFPLQATSQLSKTAQFMRQHLWNLEPLHQLKLDLLLRYLSAACEGQSWAGTVTTTLLEGSPISLCSKQSVIMYQSLFYPKHNGFCQAYLTSTTSVSTTARGSRQTCRRACRVRSVRAASRCSTDVMCSDGTRDFNWMLSRS